MKGPNAFIDHLSTNLYHPRSDAHSNAICLGILEDLLDHCAPMAEKAAKGELVARLNHTVTIHHQNWKTDLALGPPPGTPVPPPAGDRIRIAVPAVVELAVEAKGVMTEHGKARHNRLRDLQAFHGHAHSYNSKVIALGVVVVNMAPIYWSPTRSASDVTRHRNIEHVGAETVALYRNLPLRNSATEGPGLEGMSVIVVNHDNMGKNLELPTDAPRPEKTALVTRAPAPQLGDPLHYTTMIYRACTAYKERWL